MSEADERRPAGEGLGPVPVRHAAGAGPTGEPAGPYPYDDLDDEDSLLMPGPQAGWVDPNVPAQPAAGMSLADRMAAAGDGASGLIAVPAQNEPPHEAVPGPQSGMFAAMVVEEPEQPHPYAAPMTGDQIPYPPGPMTPHQEVPHPVQGFGDGYGTPPQGVAVPYPVPAPGPSHGQERHDPYAHHAQEGPQPQHGGPFGEQYPPQQPPQYGQMPPTPPQAQQPPTHTPHVSHVPDDARHASVPAGEYAPGVQPMAPQEPAEATPVVPPGGVPDGHYVEQPAIGGGRLRQRVRAAQHGEPTPAPHDTPATHVGQQQEQHGQIGRASCRERV